MFNNKIILKSICILVIQLLNINNSWSADNDKLNTSNYPDAIVNEAFGFEIDGQTSKDLSHHFCDFVLEFTHADQCCNCGIVEVYFDPHCDMDGAWIHIDLNNNGVIDQSDACACEELYVGGTTLLDGICLPNNPDGYYYEIWTGSSECGEILFTTGTFDWYIPTIDYTDTPDPIWGAFDENGIFCPDLSIVNFGNFIDPYLRWHGPVNEDECNLEGAPHIIVDNPDQPCFTEAGCYTLIVGDQCDIGCPDNAGSCESRYCFCVEEEEECEEWIVVVDNFEGQAGQNAQQTILVRTPLWSSDIEQCPYTIEITDENGNDITPSQLAGVVFTTWQSTPSFLILVPHTITITFGEECDCPPIIIKEEECEEWMVIVKNIEGQAGQNTQQSILVRTPTWSSDLEQCSYTILVTDENGNDITPSQLAGVSFTTWMTTPHFQILVPHTITIEFSDECNACEDLCYDSIEDGPCDGMKQLITNRSKSSEGKTADFSFDFLMAPNPAMDQVTINIQAEELEPFSAKLMDITGRVYYEVKNVDSYLHTIETEDFPSGSYLLQVTFNGKQMAKKLIIQQ